MSRLSCFCSSL